MLLYRTMNEKVHFSKLVESLESASVGRLRNCSQLSAPVDEALYRDDPFLAHSVERLKVESRREVGCYFSCWGQKFCSEFIRLFFELQITRGASPWRTRWPSSWAAVNRWRYTSRALSGVSTTMGLGRRDVEKASTVAWRRRRIPKV